MLGVSGASTGSPTARYSNSFSGEAYSTTAGCSATSKAASTSGTCARCTTPVTVTRERQPEVGGTPLDGRPRGTVADEQRVEVRSAGVRHEIEHALETVPVAHEPDEAQHEALLEPEPPLRLGSPGQAAELGLVDAVGDHVDPRLGHARGPHVVGEHVGHGQHGVRVAPDELLGPSRQPLEAQPAEAAALLVERRIDLEEDRHAGGARRAHARGKEQVVALVDEIGAKLGDRTAHLQVVVRCIAELEQLVGRARQPRLQRRHPARVGAERFVLDVLGPDDPQLVAERAERADQLLDVHELPVLRADAVVIEDLHAARPASRSKISSWPSVVASQSKRSA